MRTWWRAASWWLIVSGVAACGSSPSTTTVPSTSRTTETFTATTRLGSDGGTSYGSVANFPSMTLRGAGLVDATAQFTPTAQCQFILCVCRTDGNCGTCDLKAGPGAGPTLSAEGTLMPASYYLLMGARSGGQSLCGTSVLADGLPFTYTVTVTHP